MTKTTVTLLGIILFSFLTITPGKTQDPNCVKVYIHMHGAYTIRVVATPTANICLDDKPAWIPMVVGQELREFYVKKGTRLQILANTGAYKETTQFDQIINGPYNIDCGGAMGSTNKCTPKAL